MISHTSPVAHDHALFLLVLPSCKRYVGGSEIFTNRSFSSSSCHTLNNAVCVQHEWAMSYSSATPRAYGTPQCYIAHAFKKKSSRKTASIMLTQAALQHIEYCIVQGVLVCRHLALCDRSVSSPSPRSCLSTRRE